MNIMCIIIFITKMNKIILKRKVPEKNGRKTSFKNVTMVTKMLHVYISVTVPDRPIVTIIHR